SSSPPAIAPAPPSKSQPRLAARRARTAALPWPRRWSRAARSTSSPRYIASRLAGRVLVYEAVRFRCIQSNDIRSARRAAMRRTLYREAATKLNLLQRFLRGVPQPVLLLRRCVPDRAPLRPQSFLDVREAVGEAIGRPPQRALGVQAELPRQVRRRE